MLSSVTEIPVRERLPILARLVPVSVVSPLPPGPSWMACGPGTLVLRGPWLISCRPDEEGPKVPEPGQLSKPEGTVAVGTPEDLASTWLGNPELRG